MSAGVRPMWLPDAARMTGYPVVLVAGWETRGHGLFRAVELVGCHHTADGPGEYPSLRVVRDGRSDLPGPLCNFGLGRSGTIYVVASGVAWHAGASRWAGFTDLNDESLGIEAESRGTVDDWTPEQRDAYPRLVAACLHYMRRDASRVWGHKEAALPAGRKIDPAFMDMNAFRSRVAELLVDPARRIPRSGAPNTGPGGALPERNDDDMIVPCTLRRRPDGSFYGTTKIEAGGKPESQVCGRAWASLVATYGAARYAITAQDGKGRILQRWPQQPDTFEHLGNNLEALVPLPSGTRFVTFDGAAAPAAEPCASALATPYGR